jgi:GNAT superfamily N-acetyltransferase
MTGAVRIATKDDAHQVMKLALMIHEEIGVSSLSPEKVLHEVYPALCHDHGVVGVVENDEKEIIGAVLIRVVKLFYSDEPILEERGLFIHPDYRAAKGGMARKLCEFCKKVADNLGMPLRISVENDVRTKGKVRLFERQFGEPIGALFMYKPNGAVSDGGEN